MTPEEMAKALCDSLDPADVARCAEALASAEAKGKADGLRLAARLVQEPRNWDFTRKETAAMFLALIPERP